LNASTKVCIFSILESPIFVLRKTTERVYHQIFSLIKLIIFGYCSSLIFLALSIGLLKEVQHQVFYLCYWLAGKWCVWDSVGAPLVTIYLNWGKKSVLLEKKNN